MISNIEKYAVDFNDIPYERKSIERVLWGYQDLDYYTKGIEKGMTIIEADTNMGKSILASAVLVSAIKQGYNACVFASEHSNESYKNLIMQQNGRKGDFELVPFIDRNGHETNIADWYVNETVEKQVCKDIGSHLTLFNSQASKRDINVICDWIQYCHDEKKCRFCIIDNFMELENKYVDIFQGQTDMLTKLRDTFLRLNMFGILIMHINKESVSNGFRLNVKSASGTSNAGNKAYNVLGLYRKDCIYVNKGQEKMLTKFKEDIARCGFDYDQCDGFIEVIKTKGNGNGIVGLVYDKDTKTYAQAKKISPTDADKIIRRTQAQMKLSTTQCDEDFGGFIADSMLQDELPF